jgi:anti-anti-sigma factor
VLELSLPPRLDLDATLQLIELEPAAGDRSWLLVADRVTFVDSSGLAWLAMLQKKARWCGSCVILVSPSAALSRILHRMRLAEFFHTAPDLVSAMKWVESQTCVEAVAVTCDGSGKQPELRFHGEITAANAQAIWAQAQLHLSGLRTGQAWKFNLREVPFIDSTGLTLVIRAASAVRQAGATLDLIGIQPAVLNVVRHGHAEEALLGKRRPASFRLARVLSPARAG